MNPIEQQTMILNNLCQLLHDNADEGYDEACCEFKYYFGDDGSLGFGAKFHFSIDGLVNSRVFRDTNENRFDDLILKLHTLMKEHTGGDWKTFTLTLDKNGKATTKFDYSEHTSYL